MTTVNAKDENATAEDNPAEVAMAPTTDTITMSRDDLAAMMAQAAKLAVEQAKAEFLGGSGPPKAMKAKVSDGFIKGGDRGKGPALKHFRVEGIMAQKIAEYDMEKLRYYQGDGADELPVDDHGRPFSAKTMATKRKQWIVIANGDIYPTTENQVDQLLWMKQQPEEEGGLPGLYEVVDGGETWMCHVCRPERRFSNRETWENHRLATHGIPRLAAA